jgi:5-methyltetrahydropteroyltriglutamate--homocysteine methyltransferase
MLHNSDHILVSHAGSLPRSKQLIEANASRQFADDGFTLLHTPEFDAQERAAVDDVVAHQQELGVDIPNDGEYGKAMSSSVDYGAWWNYIAQRVSGLRISQDNPFDAAPVRSTPGHLQYTTFPDRRDWTRFHDVYADPDGGVLVGKTATAYPSVVGPLQYIGQDAVHEDIRNLRAAAQNHGFKTSFITAVSPGSAARVGNEYYRNDEELLFAWADVLHEEYKAITDAGLELQIDDPSIAEGFDQINPEPSIEDYLDFIQPRIEAMNYALKGIPEEQVRFHVCWGSWHGPHTTDIPFEAIIDKVLQINAGGYTFEAANVRHEHEWRVWQDHKLPDGKVIIPGVVTHSTNVIEHPRLVADRIERFAKLVGKENVIASTDCGLGGRVHPHIAWAKLDTLAKGAALASEELWG